MWTVTRQKHWDDGLKVVEISQGGIDYCNPDALVAKYPGEFEEFADPREAVQIGIKIAQAWQKDSTEPVYIGHGATGGNTLPFEPLELGQETYQELQTWAEKRAEKLARCAQCGSILSRERYILGDYCREEEFCREYCAETYLQDLQEIE